MSDELRPQIRAYLAAHPWSQCSDVARAICRSRIWTSYRLRTDEGIERRHLEGDREWRYALVGADVPDEAPPTAAHRRRLELAARMARERSEARSELYSERCARVEAVRRQPCVGCGTTWRRSPMRVVPREHPRTPEGADIGAREDLVAVCRSCHAAWVDDRAWAASKGIVAALVAVLALTACEVEPIPWPDPAEKVADWPAATSTTSAPTATSATAPPASPGRAGVRATRWSSAKRARSAGS